MTSFDIILPFMTIAFFMRTVMWNSHVTRNVDRVTNFLTNSKKCTKTKYIKVIFHKGESTIMHGNVFF